MRVRAGEVRVRHFAHVHREDCPTLEDTPELQAARLALYRWLRQRVEGRGGTVTIEDWVRDAGLPRPIDIHVRFDDGKPGLAVWLHDRQLGPDQREALEETLRTLPAVPRWVFTERMHRPLDGEGEVNLSTLERDRMERSPYDVLGPGSGSLHYLVDGNARLRTYRGLGLVHSPGTFRGTVREDLLGDVLVTRRGAFIHPGEQEALEAWQAEEEARRKREAAVKAAWARGWSEQDTPVIRFSVGTHQTGRLRAHPSRAMSYGTPFVEPPRNPSEAPCSICGRVRRWVVRNGVTGQTKCGDCVGKPYPPA